MSHILFSTPVVFVRYSVDVQLNKTVVNKEVLKDSAKRRRARTEIKSKLEERYNFLDIVLFFVFADANKGMFGDGMLCYTLLRPSKFLNHFKPVVSFYTF